jgi:molybdopterin biosynthesis enzyme MoaB
VTIVDDLERSIMNAVAEARERGVHLIVTTGGLGSGAETTGRWRDWPRRCGCPWR